MREKDISMLGIDFKIWNRKTFFEKRWQAKQDYRKELIGKSNRTKQDKLTPYIEEHDLLRF